MHKSQNMLVSLAALLLCLLATTAHAASLDSRRPPDDVDICTGGTIWCHNDCCPVRTSWCSPTGCKAGRRPPPPPPTISVTYYTVPPNCHDGVCSVTSVDDIPRVEIRGSGFSGSVSLSITKYEGGVYWSGSAGGPAVDVKTGVFKCPPGVSGSKKAYVRAYDGVSRLWSNSVDVYVGCLVL